MAIISIRTAHGAVQTEAKAGLATELAASSYAAKGFARSAVASQICRTFFNDRLSRAFSTEAGDPPDALYYVEIAILPGAIDRSGKQRLGDAIAGAILTRENAQPLHQHAGRVWIRFIDVPMATSSLAAKQRRSPASKPSWPMVSDRQRHSNHPQTWMMKSHVNACQRTR